MSDSSGLWAEEAAGAVRDYLSAEGREAVEKFLDAPIKIEYTKDDEITFPSEDLRTIVRMAERHHFAVSEGVLDRNLDLVDITAIAERLSVPKDTVNKWRHRGLLPDPDHPLAVGPVWEWDTIKYWAETTARIK